MCRSIESAILGFSYCLINLFLIIKFGNNSKVKYFVPFILNLMFVQLGNIILWLQHNGKNDLKKNNINWITTELILINLMLQPLTVSYMTNSFFRNGQVEISIYLVGIIFFIKSIKRNQFFKGRKYTVLEQGKCLKWIDSTKIGKYIFYVSDILPFIIALFFIDKDKDRNFIAIMSTILSLIYFVVSKYGLWWGSEWCSYGTAISGYIVYYLIGDRLQIN